MEFRKTSGFKSRLKRMLSLTISFSFVMTLQPLSKRAAAAELLAKAAEEPTITAYQPIINEKVDSSGFKHPGVGLTKEILENMRAEVLEKKEPWYSSYVAMTQSASASKTVMSSNQSSIDMTKPGTVAFNSQGVESKFIADGLKAYTQAILYYITGDEIYRSNAMHIIRIWSQMDPAQYKYYTDACIHSGIPLNRMVTAAEIIRYTSCETEELKWTDKDTLNFTNNLIDPVINTFQHDNNHFMNQHLYSLLGAMAGYIFTGNRERYDEGVEWFTVNKTAADQGQNGAIKQLFRLVDTNILTAEKVDPPIVEPVEMGRDLAHGAGDLTNVIIISRLLLAQGTKVDPTAGTVSTAADAVNPYEFMDNRILKAADYFWKYMLGYDPKWIPVADHTDSNGNPTNIYKQLSLAYRGRLTSMSAWDLYYYYKYTKRIDVEKLAPYYAKAFSERMPSSYYWGGNPGIYWDAVDGGGDFWLYIPKAAETDAADNMAKETDSTYIQLEDRYTAFDSNSSTKKEKDTSYIKIKATEAGSKLAAVGVQYPDRKNSCLIGLRIRTNGVAKLEMSLTYKSDPYVTLTLPNTKGQWKYITYDMGYDKVPGTKLDGQYGDLFMNIEGNGTIVDMDCLNLKGNTQLTPPVFKTGNSDLNMDYYVGAPISIDFSVSDSNTSDMITYEIENKPENAVIDSSTGVLSWTPHKAGTYSFIIAASDGTTVSTKNIKIQVHKDRKAAVAAVGASYDENKSYVTSTLENYQKVYNDVVAMIPNSSDKDFCEGLSQLKNAVERLELLTPLLKNGSMDYAKLVTSDIGNANTIGILTDDDWTTFISTNARLYQIMDFGINYKVSADAFIVQCRQGFPEREAGTAVFGSNDGENWTKLTDTTRYDISEDKQTLQVYDKYKASQFRFIKFQRIQSVSGFINMNYFDVGEFQIFGQRHETGNKISSVSISSDQAIKNRIVTGNTVKLTFTSKEEISDVKVAIQGKEADVSSNDKINWTAEKVMGEDCGSGKVKFTINYKAKDGKDKDEIVTTSDNSSLYIADETDLINDVTDKTELIDSTSGRTSAQTKQIVGYLFDSNQNTCTDFRLNGGGAGYIIFDFKNGNQALLSTVEILARQDNYYSRINGTMVQGSNDNSKWTTISDTAGSTKDWQILKINGAETYRYIRIFNSGSWYGNMAEVRFHGQIK